MDRIGCKASLITTVWMQSGSRIFRKLVNISINVAYTLEKLEELIKGTRVAR